MYQPPYSLEVNPVERPERKFGGMWRGRAQGSIEAKKAAVEEVLRRLEAGMSCVLPLTSLLSQGQQRQLL